VHGPEEERFARETYRPAMAAAAAGDVPTAFDTFMRAVGGDGYRGVLDSALEADSYHQLVRDARFFFADELPAVRRWTLSDDDARRIEQPTLIVQAADSPPRFHDACAVVADLLANAETTTLVGVSHLMPLQDPAGLGRVIAEFVGRVCRS
jgi:pimeloyl-ACP methyl ester carboxylesterase